MDLLNQLRSDLGYIVTLTIEEERDLLNRWFSDQEIEARNELVRRNIPYVIKYAATIHWKGIDRGDLISEGCIGIMDGIDHFDMSRQHDGKNIRLITYISYWIHRNIQRYIQDKGHTIRVPISNHGSINAYDKKVNELQQELGRELTQEEVDKIIAVISEKHLYPRESILATKTSSLDASPVTFIDCSTIDKEYLDLEERGINKKKLLRALKELPERERTVLCSYFEIQGEARTCLELANHYKLSRQSISLIKAKGLKRLNKIFKQMWIHPKKNGTLK